MSVLTRRALLRSVAAVTVGAGLAACTRGNGDPDPTAPGGPEDPDRALRAEIGRAETRLVELYAATAGLVPAGVATVVRDIGARHEAYRQAIDPDDLASTTSDAPSSASGSATSPGGAATPPPDAGTSPPPTPSGPLTAAAAARLLRTAELSAARARVPQSVRAVDEELARVIALAGAGSAAAAEQLRGGLA